MFSNPFKLKKGEIFMFSNLISIVTGTNAAKATGASTRIICQVGPCRCGYYLKKGCDPNKMQCAAFCVSVNQ